MEPAGRPAVSHERAADAGFVVSAGAWIIGHIVEINQVLQACAFCVAIMSGCAATYYYLRRKS